MNDQKTAVVIDSGCDVPKRICEMYDIRVLPLRVIYPEKDYQDSIDIDPVMVYERFPEEFPSTSTPSLAEVTNMFDSLKEEGFEHAIFVCISSGLSGTYNTICTAAEQYDGLDVFALNSLNISFGSGVFALWAAKRLQDGATFEELKEELPSKLADSKVFFYMDTLMYLQRGGRIGKVASNLGELLKLKPLISCNEEGVYYTVAKIRGEKQGKKKLFDEVAKFCQGHKVWLAVEHGNAMQEGEAMVKMLEEGIKDKTVMWLQQITATMAINTGPGLVGVIAFRV